MGYAVRNDSLGWRAVDSASECLLNENYSAMQPLPPVSTPAQLLASTVVAALAAGLSIKSTGTLAINGTYPLDGSTQQEIGQVTLFTQVNGNFPGGTSSYPWPDTSGAMHIFPSVAVFDEWATAIANYVAALKLYGAGVPGFEMPAASLTIA